MIKNSLFRWLPALIVMIVIFVLSAMPGKSVAVSTNPITKPLAIVEHRSSLFSGLSPIPWLKVGHFVGYAVLGLMLFRGFSLSGIDNEFYPTITSFLYACSDELHQQFVAGRSGSFSDVLLDTSAAFAAVILFVYLRQTVEMVFHQNPFKRDE